VRQFARVHQIGHIVPGKVTKLVPFGVSSAWARASRAWCTSPSSPSPRGDPRAGRAGRRRRHGQGHRHRPRASPHLALLKQANEGGESDEVHFDPSAYGMDAQYDEQGNYIYPEGFDPETGDWQEGFDTQREEWERQYAQAQERYEAHKKQIEQAKVADAEAAKTEGAESSYSSADSVPEPEGAGTLASDEALAALREKLAGGRE